MHFPRRITLAAALVLAGCGNQSVATPCDPSGDATCFSPCQNLKRAYDKDALGCPCTPGVDEPACVRDASGLEVSLECGAEGRWIANQGPCSSGP
ncbi:MAG: hypothetical protein ACOX6T_17265 [Myxococcales bacterium]|jgi:hypothetical protein